VKRKNAVGCCRKFCVSIAAKEKQVRVGLSYTTRRPEDLKSNDVHNPYVQLNSKCKPISRPQVPLSSPIPRPPSQPKLLRLHLGLVFWARVSLGPIMCASFLGANSGVVRSRECGVCIPKHKPLIKFSGLAVSAFGVHSSSHCWII